jgi:hypothetical protein
MGDQLLKISVVATTLIGAVASIVQVVDFMRTGKVSTVLISAGVLFLAVPICVLAVVAVRTAGTIIWNPGNITVAASSAVAVLGILGLVVVLVKAPDGNEPNPPTAPLSPPTASVSPSLGPVAIDPAVACARPGDQDPVVLRGVTRPTGSPGSARPLRPTWPFCGNRRAHTPIG